MRAGASCRLNSRLYSLQRFNVRQVLKPTDGQQKPFAVVGRTRRPMSLVLSPPVHYRKLELPVGVRSPADSSTVPEPDPVGS